MALPFSTALYYPRIEIDDDVWLRGTALFWDSIRSIVPTDYANPYASGFARELHDEGVLQPYYVESNAEEINELTGLVLAYFRDNTAKNLARENLVLPDASIDVDDEIYDFGRIHPGKLPHAIKHQLRESLRKDGYFHLDPGLANFYMTLLATRVADRIGAGLVTDSIRANDLSTVVRKGPSSEYIERTGFGRGRGMYDSVKASNGNAQGLMLEVLLKDIAVPLKVTAKDIVAFRTRHRDELSILRREISRLVDQVPQSSSPEALLQAVRDLYAANIEPAVKSLRASLRANKWNAFIGGTIKVSSFSIGATSAAVLAGIPSEIATIAGVGLTVALTAVEMHNSRKSAIDANPYSYLLSLEKAW